MARTRRSELGAYHEAGHAVVGLYFGIHITGVILRGRGGRPTTYLKGPPRWDDFTVSERRPQPRKDRMTYFASFIMFQWAGYCVERVAMRRWGKRWLTKYPFWNTTDYWQTVDYLIACGLRPRRGSGRIHRRIMRFQRSTMKLVEDMWPAIEAVAKALLKRRAMRFKGIRTVALRACERLGYGR
jgi:hypothetical protein